MAVGARVGHLGLTATELQAFDVGRIRPGTKYAQNHAEQRPVDGERIPTLAQVFALVAARGDTSVRFNIETKLSPDQPLQSPEPHAFVKTVLQVAHDHGMLGRMSLQSFDWRTLQASQMLAPSVPKVYLSAQQSWGNQVADARWTAGLSLAEHGSVPRLVKAAGGAPWSPHFGDLSAELMHEANALGLTVVVRTVNEPADIERMLALRVDGIISDRPDRVRAAMVPTSDGIAGRRRCIPAALKRRARAGRAGRPVADSRRPVSGRVDQSLHCAVRLEARHRRRAGLRRCQPKGKPNGH